MASKTVLTPVKINHTEVDLLVIGSGTGLATALAAKELGLNVAVAEKTQYVGGSTARSGGAFWIPANPVLQRDGAVDSAERGEKYIEAVVAGTSPAERWKAFLEFGDETVRMLERMTQLSFFWAKGYSDYHPEKPGGSAAGRSVEAHPFDLNKLGEQRGRFQPATMEAPMPMPVTGADYKWLNLIAKTPVKALPRAIKRVAQGVGGLVIGRDYGAGGQAIAAGMYAGALEAGIPVWTEASLVELESSAGVITAAVLEQDGERIAVHAKYGIVLAAGGFDHNMPMRRKYQSPSMHQDLSLGAAGNNGDAIVLAEKLDAQLAGMGQSWWFPSVAPLEEGASPMILLAERSLPGSFMVDSAGKRFINESTDYMSFGQEVLRREAAGDPVGEMWLVFDQTYRDSYLFAGQVFPRMALPEAWYTAGIAHKSSSIGELAAGMGVSAESLAQSLHAFNEAAGTGIDDRFGRGASAYDRYYGDPTQSPNPNLRPLDGKTYYAVKVVLSDLGTCGGILTDGHGRALDTSGEVIEGLYAQGNSAANIFGEVYPGAGATISQGLVYGTIIATHAAQKARSLSAAK
ncbi:3-ketosteroid-delta-1-dehydrogenase [Glutamicibacter sp.]|uniref:3-ketosteroid-delta-1-dehydrogenase n=1 Tax=Glutamicibacter sp. TaxID=1931995 RepID=UPI0028BD98DF|nr:3-ketosteroid-delta-1-dehydrogenase [Glutamicibacter sp.]